MKRASDKVVVITGASSGIGLATAKRLSACGCRVYGIARRPFSGEGFECFQADVTDLASVENVLQTVFEREGRIDAVVNNAGMGIAGAVEYATPEISASGSAYCIFTTLPPPSSRPRASTFPRPSRRTVTAAARATTSTVL